MDCNSIWNRVSQNVTDFPRKHFPIAFARTVYRDYDFLELQVAQNYHPRNQYCFMFDRKADNSFVRRMKRLERCVDNVYLAKPSVPMDSRGYNQNLGHLKCLELLSKKPGWRYALLLQNHDVILRTNAELGAILRMHLGMNDVMLQGIWRRPFDWLLKNIPNESSTTTTTTTTEATNLHTTTGQASKINQIEVNQETIQWTDDTSYQLPNDFRVDEAGAPYIGPPIIVLNTINEARKRRKRYATTPQMRQAENLAAGPLRRLRAANREIIGHSMGFRLPARKKLRFSRGMVQAALSREAVVWMSRKHNSAVRQLASKLNVKGVYGVDEILLPTLQASSREINFPGGVPECPWGMEHQSMLRLKFSAQDGGCLSGGISRHGVCIVGIEYLPQLKKSPYIAVNKMMPSLDAAAISCMAERVFNRTHFRATRTSPELLRAFAMHEPEPTAGQGRWKFEKMTESMVDKVLQAGSGTLQSACEIPVGSTVHFKTALGEQVSGLVACFDPSAKMIAIKDGSGQKPLIRVFNLVQITELRRDYEAGTDEVAVEGLASTSQNHQALIERMKSQEVMQVPVDEHGQKVFLNLRHVFQENVTWNGANIEALDLVLVQPPYGPANAVLKKNEERGEAALEQVRKVLAKPFVLTEHAALNATCIFDGQTDGAEE
ncbi:unnamed protein product, partial [Mesorhabditis spiculigera]